MSCKFVQNFPRTKCTTSSGTRAAGESVNLRTDLVLQCNVTSTRTDTFASLNAFTYCGSIGAIGAQHELHEDNATLTVCFEGYKSNGMCDVTCGDKKVKSISLEITQRKLEVVKLVYLLRYNTVSEGLFRKST